MNNTLSITDKELYIKSILSVVRKNWTKNEIENSKNVVIQRKPDLFVFVTKGEALYECDGHSILLRPGDIIFLSHGCTYKRRILSNQYSTIFIDFHFDVPSECVLPCGCFRAIEGIDLHFLKLYKTWTSRTSSYLSDCMSIFYNIYARMVRSETFSYIPKSKRELFEAAIRTISNSYTKEELSIATLADQAQMSEVHFRRCFKKIYNTSPQQYIMNLRITHAKELLQYNIGSMVETAHASGFTDPCYFNRIFKQKTGYTPLEYRKEFGIHTTI